MFLYILYLRNTEVFQAIAQNETSITLQWNKVDEILNYRLLFNGIEIDVTASVGHEQVTHTITGLTSGTKYDFTLFTVFENVSSSGVNLSAATGKMFFNDVGLQQDPGLRLLLFLKTYQNGSKKLSFSLQKMVCLQYIYILLIHNAELS